MWDNHGQVWATAAWRQKETNIKEEYSHIEAISLLKSREEEEDQIKNPERS